MYKSGEWGKDAKERSKRRKAYFREYARKRLERLGKTPRQRKERKRVAQHAYDSIGLLGEKYVIQNFPNTVWVGEKFDLLWLGKKVDVKTSLPVKLRVTEKRWKFCLTRQKGIVDFYILIGLKEDRTLDSIYVIPEPEAPKYVSIILSSPSKYDQYRMSLS